MSCAVSVPNTNTALSVVSNNIIVTNWRDSIGRRSVRTPNNDSVPFAQNDSSYSAFIAQQVYKNTLPPLSKGWHRFSDAIGDIYAPAIAELWREYDELLALVRALAETSSTFAEFIIKRASRGLNVSRIMLQDAGLRLRHHMPRRLMSKRPSPAQSFTQARRGLDRLSTFVDEQSAAFSDLIEEQTTAVRETMLDSVKQARKGLDRLVDDVSAAVGRDVVERVELPPLAAKRKATDEGQGIRGKRFMGGRREGRDARRARDGGMGRGMGRGIRARGPAQRPMGKRSKVENKRRSWYKTQEGNEEGRGRKREVSCSWLLFLSGLTLAGCVDLVGLSSICKSLGAARGVRARTQR